MLEAEIETVAATEKIEDSIFSVNFNQPIAIVIEVENCSESIQLKTQLKILSNGIPLGRSRNVRKKYFFCLDVSFHVFPSICFEDYQDYTRKKDAI